MASGTSPSRSPSASILACALLLLAVGGCESINRAIFNLNEGLDTHLIAPAVDVYELVVPSPVRDRVGSVLATIATIPTLANNLLQGKLSHAIEDGARVATNLTVGVAGVFDVATAVGIPQHEEDFGQTLAVWGVPSGPYLVLPLMGPSTLRDAWDLPFRFVFGPALYLNTAATLAVSGISGLQERSEADPMIRRRDESALDRYVFTREAYLQRRRFLVLDGNVPDDDIVDDSALDELMDLPDESNDPEGESPARAPRAAEAAPAQAPARPPQ